MSRSVATATAVLVAGLALSACGGGGHLSQPLSMAEYIERADAACKAGHESLESHKPELESPTETPSEKAAVMVEAIRTELDALRALTPPAAQRDTIESMLAMEENQAENVEGLAAATESGDQARLQAVLREGAAEQQRMATLARQLGLHICGQSG